MKKYSILGLLAGLALTGCATKPGPADTTVAVRVAIEAGATPRDTVYKKDWDAFYFYADTVFYAAPTLADVLAKQLRAKAFAGNTVPSTIAFEGLAEIPDTTGVRFEHLKAKAVLVVHDPDTEAYAWRQLDVVDGLPEVSLAFYIRTWKTDSVYVENKWTIVLDRSAESDDETDESEEPEKTDPDDSEEPEETNESEAE